MQKNGLDPRAVPALKFAVKEADEQGCILGDAFTLGQTRIGMSFKDASGQNHLVEFRPQNWRYGGKVVAAKIALGGA